MRNSLPRTAAKHLELLLKANVVWRCELQHVFWRCELQHVNAAHDVLLSQVNTDSRLVMVKHKPHDSRFGVLPSCCAIECLSF